MTWIGWSFWAFQWWLLWEVWRHAHWSVALIFLMAGWAQWNVDRQRAAIIRMIAAKIGALEQQQRELTAQIEGLETAIKRNQTAAIVGGTALRQR